MSMAQIDDINDAKKFFQFPILIETLWRHFSQMSRSCLLMINDNFVNNIRGKMHAYFTLFLNPYINVKRIISKCTGYAGISCENLLNMLRGILPFYFGDITYPRTLIGY